MLRTIFAMILGAALSACAALPLSSKNLELFYSSKLIATPKENDQQQAYANPDQACVILIHGLWRSSFAMRGIQATLDEHGFHTVNISYPSTELSIDEIAKNYIEPAATTCQKQRKLTHIVTHSMGGIVARAYLQNNRLPQGSRVVMLSPPNQGSELSERFHDHSWYQALVGPAATSMQRITEKNALNKLTEFPEPLGIIAAYRDWSIWPESWLPSPNDGIVSVESMLLEGMDDLTLVNSGHAMMRYSSEVERQIINFLEHGRFLNKQASQRKTVIQQKIESQPRLKPQSTSALN